MLRTEEKGDAKGQKLHADTFTSHVSTAVSLLLDRSHRYMQFQERKDLVLTFRIKEKDSIEDRKQNVVRQPRLATRVVCVRSVKHIFTSVQSKEPTKHVEETIVLIFG